MGKPGCIRKRTQGQSTRNSIVHLLHVTPKGPPASKAFHANCFVEGKPMNNPAG
jgi:hypothetical protein